MDYSRMLREVKGMSRDALESQCRDLIVILRAIGQQLPCSIFLKDLDGRFKFVSNMLAETVGGTAPELMIGKTDSSYFTDESAREFSVVDRMVIDSFIHESVPSPNSRRENYEPLHAPHREIETIKSGYYDASGNVAGIVGYFHDQTESFRTERALRDEVHAIFENCPDAVYTHGAYLNSDSKFFDANHRVYAMTGYTRDEFKELKITDLVYRDDYERIAAPHLKEKIEAGPNADKTTNYDVRIRKKDGAVAELCVSTKIIWHGSIPHKVIGVARDLTQLRKESAAFIRDVIVASSEGAISAIIVRMCHELKRPLTSASLLASGIRLDLELPEAVRAKAADIAKLCSQAWEYGEQYFNRLSRPELQFTVVDLRTLLLEVKHHVTWLVRTALARNTPASTTISFQMELAREFSDDIEIRADRVLLTSAFINFVANAIDASSQCNANATIEIVLLPNPAEGIVTVRFRDTCGGIDVQILSDLNTPGRLAKSSKGNRFGVGTGLARAVIESHNGKYLFANYESSGQKGARIDIELPII